VGSVFLINVPGDHRRGIAAAIMVPESRNPNAGKIDYVGVLLSIAALCRWCTGSSRGDGDSC